MGLCIFNNVLEQIGEEEIYWQLLNSKNVLINICYLWSHSFIH